MGLMGHVSVTFTLYFSNVKYSVCNLYIFFVFTPNCICAYCSHPVEPLIIEHLISTATISRISIKYKLHIINMMVLLTIFLAKRTV
jgi:hypothetical protein